MNTTNQVETNNTFLNNLKNTLAGIGALAVAFVSGNLVGVLLNAFY